MFQVEIPHQLCLEGDSIVHAHPSCALGCLREEPLLSWGVSLCGEGAGDQDPEEEGVLDAADGGGERGEGGCFVVDVVDDDGVVGVLPWLEGEGCAEAVRELW